MKRWVYIGVVLTLLLATAAVSANKLYRSCFRHKCQADQNNRRCCRIGAKVAKHSYDCTVDTVIATQRYKLTFRQKTHSQSPQQSDTFYTKVKKCKRYDSCFECCCKHKRKRLLNPRIRGRK